MNRKDVADAIEKIKRVITQGDNETAHCLQDELCLAVLEEIASGEDETSSKLAKAALEANELDFERWYA